MGCFCLDEVVLLNILRFMEELEFVLGMNEIVDVKDIYDDFDWDIELGVCYFFLKC